MCEVELLILALFKRFSGRPAADQPTGKDTPSAGTAPQQEKPFAYPERQEEVKDLERVLGEFGIGLDSLVKVSPEPTQLRPLIKACRQLAQDAELMRELIKLKQLPFDDFAAKSGLPLKTVKQHSRYLISMILIYNGPYPYLRQYLQSDIPQK